MEDNAIRLDHLSKRFGDMEVVKGVSADFPASEFIVILGPSGCGKTTILNMIAGLEDVSSGRILIGGREVQDKEPKDRGCAMVFQNYALYPHMSVAENIGYALKVARVPVPERSRRIAEAARVVDLESYLEHRPGQLSGGQRQRVAIARAIVREPKVMLFDEPLSNLDAKLRHSMRQELTELHRRIGATSVFVTHDQIEAMTLADRVLVLNRGRVEQFARPKDIYHKPASTFVAGFIGTPPMNLIPAVGESGCLRLTDGTEIAHHQHVGPVTVGVRPERIAIGTGGLSAQVSYREDLGSHTVLLARLSGGQELNVVTPHGIDLEFGETVSLRFSETDLHIFHPETGLRLDEGAMGQDAGTT